MTDVDQHADFSRRATKVRTLLDGVFDKTDRRYMRKFVADAEKLAAVTSQSAIFDALRKP